MDTDTGAMRLSAGGRDLYELILERIDGRPMRLARYWGQVLLIVNVTLRGPSASQLEELQALHERYGEAGLRVLAFPCDDFSGMEVRDNAQMQHYCERSLGLSFPLFTKVTIASTPCHPLFAMLAKANGVHSGAHDVRPHVPSATPPESTIPGGRVQGDFEKFLVSRDGRLLHRFASEDRPQAPQVLAALENALETPRVDVRTSLQLHSPTCHPLPPTEAGAT